VRITEYHDIIDFGPFSKTGGWKKAWTEIKSAVRATDWPHGSGKFTIYPQSGKKRKEGSGVLPIKVPCLKKLKSFGWEIEKLPRIEMGILRTGDLDALKKTKTGFIGFEWETGNISSSHRAINKLLLTLVAGGIKGGFLVVPSDDLKQYLTDRIGNIGELRPYFPLWKSIRINNGILRIVVVEHDRISLKVPRIPKSTDGRALG